MADDTGRTILHDIGTGCMYGWFPDQNSWLYYRKQGLYQSVR